MHFNLFPCNPKLIFQGYYKYCWTGMIERQAEFKDGIIKSECELILRMPFIQCCSAFLILLPFQENIKTLPTFEVASRSITQEKGGCEAIHYSLTPTLNGEPRSLTQKDTSHITTKIFFGKKHFFMLFTHEVQRSKPDSSQYVFVPVLNGKESLAFA